MVMPEDFVHLPNSEDGVISKCGRFLLADPFVVALETCDTRRYITADGGQRTEENKQCSLRDKAFFDSSDCSLLV